MRILPTLVVMALLPAAVSGQRVVGRVLESGNDKPVANVSLRLENADGVRSEVVSDSLGRFTLRANGSGSYTLSTYHIAYAPARASVQLGANEQLDLIVRVTVSPTELPPIVIVARSRAPDPALERVGFYERKAEGFGVFRTPEDIEKRKPYATSDLFQSVNGIRIIYLGLRGKDILVTRGEDPNCSPRLIIDNVIIRRGGRFSRTDDPVLDQVVQPQDINAIEIYRSTSETPKQYQALDVVCGVVVIWTKRGSAR
jgi:hypothetical protein